MTGEVRIGDQARAVATRTLDAALREGRLDLAEYERRLVIVQAAKVRKDLTPAVADLPDGSGRTKPGLRITTADRERALVRLAGALTDGRMEARAYAEAEELLNRAVTYSDIDAVVGNLDAKASHLERDQAVARIEAAVAGGLLDPAEQHDRVAAVRRATTDSQLAALVADLPAEVGVARSPRASHADREAVVAQLHDAVEAGVLDLPEFDERVRAVYAARLRDELARLVADLPKPAEPASLPPAPPVDVPPPAPSLRAVKNVNLIATLATVPVVGSSVILGALGFVLPAILAAVGGVIVLVVWTVRASTAAIDAESAARAADWDRRMAPPPLEEATWVDVDPAEWTPRERVLGRHKGDLKSITTLVLPDGTPVAITGGRDNTARVWNLSDDSWRHTLSGHTHDVTGVAAMVLPDGVPVAVTVSPDRTARVWDLRDGSPRATLPGLAPDAEAVRCLSLADGTPVAVVHNGCNAIQTWDLRDHKRRHNVRQGTTFLHMVPVVFPDGTPVAVVSDWGNHLRVVNLSNGKPRFRLSGHTQPVNAIDATVLADGTPVAVSAGQDKTIRVWDLRRQTLLHTISGLVQAKETLVCTALPDGTPVAVACDWEPGNTTVWDLRDGSELPFRFDFRGTVLGAAALPDRTLLLGLSEDPRGAAVRELT